MEIIGIDFGTTNTSVIGIQRDENGEIISPLGENGKNYFPSLLAIDMVNNMTEKH